MNKNSFYFGYGSLVNRKTRDAAEPWFRATLNGWIRQWAHKANRPWALDGKQGEGVCAVTVLPRDNASIDGVLVPIPTTELPQLDEREASYHRVMLPMSTFTLHDQTDSQNLDALDSKALNSDTQIIVYVSDAPSNLWASHQHPLITSYVHCVMAGFNQVYGADGLERFMQTTEGWSLPLLDDRHEPIYPRAVQLGTAQQSHFDQQLNHYASADLSMTDQAMSDQDQENP